MKMPMEDANRVLALCREARQAPSSKIAGTLLRMTNVTMPPALLRAANDAIFFVIIEWGKSFDPQTIEKDVKSNHEN